MVQSLLLNGSTSLKNSELKVRNDNDIASKSEDVLKQVDSKNKQQNFSEVLKENINSDSLNKEAINKESADKEKSTDVSALEEALISKEQQSKLSHNVDDAKDEDSQNLLNEELENNLDSSVEINVLITENKINNEVKNEAQLANLEKVGSESINDDIDYLDRVDETNDVDIINADNQQLKVTSSQQDQLLSSIQAAQQVNTNISNTNTSVEEASVISTETIKSELINNNAINTKAIEIDQFSNADEKNKSDLLTSTEKVGQALTGKAINNSVENTSDEAELTLTDSNNESSLQLLNTDKSDVALNPVKAEASITSSVADVNGTKPIQTNLMQTEKLVAVNQQVQANNNLLEQPLDIQSKQAASAIGERVMMMISQSKQEVQIRLDPAELGSIFIKAHVHQDQVQLNIQTQAGLSKDIIEQNMPRLREQLAQQGLQLGEANVEQQSQQQNQSSGHGQGQMSTMAEKLGQNVDLTEDNQTAMWIPSKIASKEQGIDYYA
ncbi:flagellar hook-length control protein FliK [Psychromonas sp. SP041]|uniref:flagellar hook-length control protein FliK n=1 Tax=Psychromonas sp. SP041 TaxID=1365007 RepID=UPI0010C7C5DE|nr:flagellar hook-length control protein FliK [Psychromonas sp. SP041]